MYNLLLLNKKSIILKNNKVKIKTVVYSALCSSYTWFNFENVNFFFFFNLIKINLFISGFIVYVLVETWQYNKIVLKVKTFWR